jgi:hypothetical protein
MDAEKYCAESLRKAEFIIIDEISMLHKDVLHYIDRLLRDIAPAEKRHLPFGGKVVVLGGGYHGCAHMDVHRCLISGHSL